jgi:hypothetical protein
MLAVILATWRISHEPHGLKPSGLSLSLRTSLTASREATGRDNRPHDFGPGYVYRGIAISVIAMSTVDTTKGSLTLPVLFCTVFTDTTHPGCGGWINGMQWDASKSSFVGEKETQLRK